MQIDQEQIINYSKFALLQIYSFTSTIVYHLTNATKFAISNYPDASFLLLSFSAVIIGIYLVKNLTVLLLSSIVTLFKFLIFLSAVTIGVIVYYRGFEFFTVDLVNAYHLVLKDVEKGQVYGSETILNNLESIYYKESENLIEKNHEYAKLAVSKYELVKKFLLTKFF